MKITAQQLAVIMPRLRNSAHLPVWVTALNEILPKYRIDTPQRVAAFLSQTGHESLDFTILTENLNYSADALHKVFRKYFPTLASAQPFHRKPEMIANRVYGGRMGNGPEATGDGYRYRGRGLMQVTGKNNYDACSVYLFKNDRLLKDPDFLTTPEGALMSACWFWTANNLNAIADREDNHTLTRRINGGTHGLEDRLSRYDRAIKVLR